MNCAESLFLVCLRKVSRSLGEWVFWLLPLSFLLLFFFYPLVSILILAGRSAIEAGFQGLAWERVGRSLWFTIWQATLSTSLTLLLGLPGAYVFARYRFWAKRLWGILVSLPFILPTVVVATGFNALLGARGFVNLLLMNGFGLEKPPIQIMNTLSAILLAHVFYNTTIVLRIVGGSWTQLDQRLEQAARSLGATPLCVFREITLPLLRPAILSAILLVFLFDFTSFGVILLLGGPKFATLEVEIYIQALHMLNLPLAGLLSVIQLLCTLLITWLYLSLNQHRAVFTMPRVLGEYIQAPHGLPQRLMVGGILVILGILLVTPLIALGMRSFARLEAERGERGEVATGWTLAYYQELFINRRGSLFYVPPIEALQNSLSYASQTVVISLGLGLLAAVALNRQKSKSPSHPFELQDHGYDRAGHLNRQGIILPIGELFLMLPLGASAVTLGLGFLVAFNQPPLDARTFPFLIPIAHSLVALPFVVRTLQPALASIPPVLRQAAAVLGAKPWRVWLEVDLPIIFRAMVSSGVFAFTISMGEFGATTFLARPEHPTLPVAIYRFLSQPGALNYGQALAMATLLMLICAIGIFLIERLRLPGGEGV